MRLLRWALLLGIALVYYLWPYAATRKFFRAVEAKDAATILEMTDREALRKSLTDLAVESAVIRELELRGRRVDEASLRAEARRRLELPAAQRQIDAGMDVETMRERLQAGPNFADGEGWGEERWHSPWEFSVGDRSGGRLVFRFNGLGWRHTGFEFSKAELRQRTAEQFGR
jgi:hypothetical protein